MPGETGANGTLLSTLCQEEVKTFIAERTGCGRRVIFLDVDGVLNPGNHMERTREVRSLDPTCLSHLKELVEHTGADLILSSDWRFSEFATLNRSFSEYGLALADRTGPARCWRHEEIEEWLQIHPEVECYVILDDVNDYFQGENLRRLVLTDEAIGLTDADVLQAKRILEKDFRGSSHYNAICSIN